MSCGHVTPQLQLRWAAVASASMGKVKKGVKKFQKKIAGGGVHKKKKLHFRRDKADAAKAAESQELSAAVQQKKAGALLPNAPLLCSAPRECKTTSGVTVVDKVFSAVWQDPLFECVCSAYMPLR